MKLKQKETTSLAPLLPKITQTPNEGASVSSAVFNISTCMIGAGIMSIPATLKVLGIVPGFLLIVVMALLVDLTVEFLLRYTHSGNSNSYAGVMAESFGKPGSWALQFCIILSNLGGLIIYFIVIGDVLTGSQSSETIHLGILQEWFGIHWWNSRPFALLFVVLFVLLPLLLQPRIESLGHASAVSILLALVFVAISLAMAIYAIWAGTTMKLRLFPDISSTDSFLTLFTTIPVLASGLVCHIIIHPVKAELSKTSDMISAVRMSLLLTVSIYFAVGFIGYLLFGDTIMSDMLVNFDKNSDSPLGLLVNDVVRLSYSIHLLLVFPVINFSLRANIDELLFPKKNPLESDTPRFVCLTCAILSIAYLAAIVIPDIWYFFQFVGSTTIACLAFVFPGAIVLRDAHGISTRRDRIMAVVVILLAILTSSIAISNNLYS
ncbi:hypothetical protein DCAR_0830787 [Daucus carota subsp. sativus]|uniref:Amino acid transporter transmembrane domain-containing protein n=1 Tax=Daucus carota subsp. sativus TaxID=79200 RepID=A0AAF0XNE4_DAUCS|nr:PREDICTED: probable sodium-coupled neutral amino acid transporter 6 [Daucus carota subsp. sativus]WOH11306.1 hypothetical protein DCAR_0830787 [Daucus carota subsp. sativus]